MSFERSAGRRPTPCARSRCSAATPATPKARCWSSFGDTQVLCTASVEEKVPPHKRGSGQGWVTAEYGMLPRATHTRSDREAATGKQSGRTQEIQRLIGRSLRACSTSARWASAPSSSTATCCRPTAARAPRPSPAPSSPRTTP